MTPPGALRLTREINRAMQERLTHPRDPELTAGGARGALRRGYKVMPAPPNEYDKAVFKRAGHPAVNLGDSTGDDAVVAVDFERPDAPPPPRATETLVTSSISSATAMPSASQGQGSAVHPPS